MSHNKKIPSTNLEGGPSTDKTLSKVTFIFYNNGIKNVMNND